MILQRTPRHGEDLRIELLHCLCCASWRGVSFSPCLLALNGLRVSEALGADIGDYGLERGHHTLRITRKGGTPALIPMAPRTARTVYQAVGDREEGPIFVHNGHRMERHHAARIIRRLPRQAGIDKKISPHSLRHSFITAALDAGVPLRDVQEAASHADPRTTMRTTGPGGHSTATPPTSSPPSSQEPPDEPLRRT